jgi:UDP-N-acetylmuramate--alanine ligase
MIHFIGIGGSGVSYLAQWYLAKGYRVSGSDLAWSPILKLLRKKGAKINVGRHQPKNIPRGTKLVIYTQAAPKNNPERQEARTKKIPQISHSEALGELTKNHYTIAIAGSHGKSTTTALAGLLLVRAGLDPTVFLGTTLKEFGGSNCRIGKSPYLVIEADEWKGAFWYYLPHIIILTNIDREHLDFYRNFAGVKEGFARFLSSLPPNGLIIANADDRAARQVALRANRLTTFYSLKNPLASRVRKIIKIPGEHNVSNALAVGMLSKMLGISQNIFLETIASYRGAWRRFEYRGKLNGAKIFDDYAHHPTEIDATLQAARTLLNRRGRLWCVFQPHQYRRLEALFQNFKTAFDKADEVVILPVYAVAGRELKSHNLTSEDLTKTIRRRRIKARFASSFKEAAEILQKELRQGDICLLMGAGDIVEIHKVLHTT